MRAKTWLGFFLLGAMWVGTSSPAAPIAGKEEKSPAGVEANARIVHSTLQAAVDGSATTPGRSAAYLLKKTLSGYGKTADSDFESYRGKWVLVHFWASWCQPCVAEIPMLQQFFSGIFPAYPQRYWALITVNNDLREKDIRRFLQRHSLETPIFLDSYQKVNKMFDLSVLPGTVLLGPDGTVLHLWPGQVNWTSEEFNRQLMQLWHDSQPSTGGDKT